MVKVPVEDSVLLRRFFKGIRSQGGIMALSLACLYRKTFKQNASCSLRLKEDISNDLFFQKLQRQR